MTKYLVELFVQSARIAYGQAIAIASPQRRHERGAVGAGDARLLDRGQPPLVRLDQRPIVAVHLVVEAARVAQVVAGWIAAPQGCVGGVAVDALAAIYTENKNKKELVKITRWIVSR